MGNGGGLRLTANLCNIKNKPVSISSTYSPIPTYKYPTTSLPNGLVPLV